MRTVRTITKIHNGRAVLAGGEVVNVNRLAGVGMYHVREESGAEMVLSASEVESLCKRR